MNKVIIAYLLKNVKSGSVMNGYIKIYRKILANPIVLKDSDHLAIFVYLLLSATHKKLSAFFDGQQIELMPGQLITSRDTIAKKLKVNSSKVQRVLGIFQKSEIIEQQTTSRNRLISIKKWDKYQATEQQVNNKRTTSEQQVNTNNNIRMKEYYIDERNNNACAREDIFEYNWLEDSEREENE